MLVGACSTVAPCRADAGGPLRSQCHAAFSRWPYSRSTTRNVEPPPSLPIFNRGVRILAEVVQQSGPVAHGRICRHAWIVGSVVEFLDQGSELLSAEGGCKLAFESAVLLLSDCCLRGPLAGQPAIVTALGFALRRCPSLLREEARRSAGGPGPLEVLRHGLQQAEGNFGSTLRARTAETFAGPRSRKQT